MPLCSPTGEFVLSVQYRLSLIGFNASLLVYMASFWGVHAHSWIPYC